jgi:hypothetical protein
MFVANDYKMAKKKVLFNLNEYISVKLTDLGYQRLADLHNDLMNRLNRKDDFRTFQYYKDKADLDGYTKFQAWSFMADFGVVTGLTMPQHYHLDILFEANVE